MKTIKHKFLEFVINKDIEILILGTFNPDIKENEAEFFYERTRNYLWNLLPKVYGFHGLKNATKEEKIDFINLKKIGFIDLIEEIQVESGQESNYSDDFIDSKVTKWTNVVELIEQCEYLKSVFFTRKTFNGIPQMKDQIEIITNFCSERNISFQVLPTPARFENENKLNEWKKIFKL